MIKTFGLSPDAKVNGYFKSEDYTAKLTAVLSCINGKPAGTFNMVTAGTDVWHLTSSTPKEINLEKNALSDHIHAVYKATVKHTSSGRTFSNCTLFFDISEWPLGGGVVGLNVTLAAYNNLNARPVFEWDGIFLGSMVLKRDVSCGS